MPYECMYWTACDVRCLSPVCNWPEFDNQPFIACFPEGLLAGGLCEADRSVLRDNIVIA